MKIRSRVVAGLLSLLFSSHALSAMWDLEYRGKITPRPMGQIKPRSVFKSFYSNQKQLIDIVRLAQREIGFRSETTCYFTQKDTNFARKSIVHEYGPCEIKNSHILIKKNTRYICSVGKFGSSFISCSDYVDLQNEDIEFF